MRATSRNRKNSLFDDVVAAVAGNVGSHNLEMKSGRGCNRGMNS